ncbi:MAG: alpha-L-fucosidase [Oscillospiraceae bacterium]|nr:alpha-L-fucosidase [Oscillospiraceae bacterium]
MDMLLEKLAAVRPSERQLNWQAMEFYAFIHYGVNSFTDREWGDGTESPAIFNPQHLDTDQWCRAVRDAGMRAVIITAKHHDGFCLFDTAHTDHSVMHSPYGKDIVAQLAASCEKYGLKLGIYLSPWDRHDARYGSGAAYDDYFCAQLTELMSNYGELFCLWFDGACGEGPNGRVQVYDWERYYALIRRLQPDAVICIMGPDVRWCGNEAGHCRESEWSVVPAVMADRAAIAAASQQADDAGFRAKIPEDAADLGSREAVAGYTDFIWYPAEVDVSIRPGWFYHPAEDGQVRSLENLIEIYLESVGGNAAFLLNLPPHFDGYIHTNDVERLQELGDWIKSSFSTNLLDKTEITRYDEREMPCFVAKSAPIRPKYLVLQEDIAQGQRIEAFTLLSLRDGQWQDILQGTVVGHKRICRIPPEIESDAWKLRIDSHRADVFLQAFALY